MTDIANWSKVAAENTMQPPDGLPEHCLPSAVNDWARETMAAVARWYGNTTTNVKNFGAIGDGVADDTAAIQAAVDAEDNHSVYFPPGSYLIRNSITLPDASVRLFGDAATIIADEPINWPTSVVGAGFIGDATADFHAYEFDNLGFTWHVGGTGSILYLPSPTILTIKNCSASGGSSFTQISDGNVLTFTNNTVANFDVVGLYLNGDVTFARITNNHFVTTDAPLQALTTCIYYSGIKSDNTGGTAYGTIIADNHFQLIATDSMGVWVNAHVTDGETKDLLVSNNQFIATETGCYGVFVGGSATAHHIQVLNNFFESGDVANAMNPAVAAQTSTSNIQMSNNMVIGWNGGTQGVFQFLGTNGILSGNLGFGCSSPFLYLTGATNVQLIANSDGVNAPNIDITGYYKLSGHSFASSDSQYSRLYTPGENIGIYLGNSVDPINYHRNATHLFQSVDPGTNLYATIDVNGIYTPHNLSVTGLASIGSNLSVSGAAAITGNMHSGTATVDGNVTIGGGINANLMILSAGLSVGGHTDLIGTVAIGGAVAANSSITASSLAITGTSVLNGLVSGNSFTFAGNGSVGGTFGAGGTVVTGLTVTGGEQIGEALSIGTNHIADFLLSCNTSNGDTFVQMGAGTFFQLSRTDGRVYLYVGNVFQQRWPA